MLQWRLSSMLEVFALSFSNNSTRQSSSNSLRAIRAMRFAAARSSTADSSSARLHVRWGRQGRRLSRIALCKAFRFDFSLSIVQARAAASLHRRNQRRCHEISANVCTERCARARMRVHDVELARDFQARSFDCIRVLCVDWRSSIAHNEQSTTHVAATFHENVHANDDGIKHFRASSAKTKTKTKTRKKRVFRTIATTLAWRDLLHFLQQF
jgi:hypothetical protein